MRANACSACYGSGYTLDKKSCPCGCMPLLKTAQDEEIERLREEVQRLSAQLRAVSNELTESRANDRTTMGYLSSIRQAVEFDGDFPALVEHCRDLWQSMQHPSYEVENRLRAERNDLREQLAEAQINAERDRHLRIKRLADIAADPEHQKINAVFLGAADTNKGGAA